MLVAGSAGGAFKTGTHLAYNGEPIADLYLAVLTALGAPATTFGTHGKRPLSGVL
jgi:hypothetical protein